MKPVNLVTQVVSKQSLPGGTPFDILVMKITFLEAMMVTRNHRTALSLRTTSIFNMLPKKRGANIKTVPSTLNTKNHPLYKQLKRVEVLDSGDSHLTNIEFLFVKR